MDKRQTQPFEDDHEVGEAFKREGPEPPTESTGRTVEEMNEKAREALLRNIRPEPDDDLSTPQE